jgi:hypothetical protein
MKLFDYMKVLFGSDAEWDKLTSYDKSKNVFYFKALFFYQG